jgi:hypothetical protein
MNGEGVPTVVPENNREYTTTIENTQLVKFKVPKFYTIDPAKLGELHPLLRAVLHNAYISEDNPYFEQCREYLKEVT